MTKVRSLGLHLQLSRVVRLDGVKWGSVNSARSGGVDFYFTTESMRGKGGFAAYADAEVPIQRVLAGIPANRQAPLRSIPNLERAHLAVARHYAGGMPAPHHSALPP